MNKTYERADFWSTIRHIIQNYAKSHTWITQLGSGGLTWWLSEWTLCGSWSLLLWGSRWFSIDLGRLSLVWPLSCLWRAGWVSASWVASLLSGWLATSIYNTMTNHQKNQYDFEFDVIGRICILKLYL